MYVRISPVYNGVSTFPSLALIKFLALFLCISTLTSLVNLIPSILYVYSLRNLMLIYVTTKQNINVILQIISLSVTFKGYHKKTLLR